MKPVVTVEEMRSIDRDATEPTDVLVHRAGWCVARTAKRMLGGTYGRHVVVVAGPGNNGNDGRVAAGILRTRGVRVTIGSPGEFARIPRCDLVIDAAFGTGFHGAYDAPMQPTVPVLAVDIPSGVDGDSGQAFGRVLPADVTVTFAALKPGHLFGAGRELSGSLEVCDIGLDVTAARMNVIERSDVTEALGPLQAESHKWRTAIAVVAGSPGMLGAAQLTALGAARAGAGMVRLLLPGVSSSMFPVTESVVLRAEDKDWTGTALQALDRVKVLVLGPGLGRDERTLVNVRRLLAESELPAVVDADGLFAFTGQFRDILARRSAPTVVTPHDGELRRLTGTSISDRRFETVRLLASELRLTVLSKGSTSTIADYSGEVMFSTTGDSRLATAGTGDVLAGVVGAFLARGWDASFSAAAAAHVHGEAARSGLRRGLLAGDLPGCIARWLSDATMT